MLWLNALYFATTRQPAVFTSMRDPVERVLSAYEFVIQNAQKELMNEKKEARPKGSPDVAKKRMQGSKVNTLQVYPWSILVPLLQVRYHFDSQLFQSHQ